MNEWSAFSPNQDMSVQDDSTLASQPLAVPSDSAPTTVITDGNQQCGDASCPSVQQLQHDISQVTLNNDASPDVRQKQPVAEPVKNASSDNIVDQTMCPTEMSIRDAMLSRIANSDAHFKHQQRGEPDLTYDSKLAIATELLENKPTVFLSRFGKYLTEEDLSYFIPLRDDYIVDFHLKEIRRRQDDKKNKTKIRNRRYEAMKEMLSKGDYFSDEEMKRRDPLLYEQMIGKFLTDEEIAAEIDKTDLSFSNILLKHIQVKHNETLYQYQKDIEEGQMEEEEEEEEDDEEQEMEEEDFGPGADGRVSISDAERALLRNEFMRTMQLRFLNGEDPEFSYGDVDENVEFDSVDLRTRDEEEKYFDDDDAETAESLDSSGTPKGFCKRLGGPDDLGCDLLETDESKAEKT